MANPEVCGDSGAWGSLRKGSRAAPALPSLSDGFARAAPTTTTTTTTTKERPRPVGGAVPGAAILRRQVCRPLPALSRICRPASSSHGFVCLAQQLPDLAATSRPALFN